MSTRCLIAIKRENGTYKSIYCHNDGYPEGVGATLNKFYTNENKINRLMDLGDISSLGSSLNFKNPNDYFKNPSKYFADNGTTDYNRWRNEGTAAVISLNIDELRQNAKDCSSEYLYIFEDGKWTTESI